MADEDWDDNVPAPRHPKSRPNFPAFDNDQDVNWSSSSASSKSQYKNSYQHQTGNYHQQRSSAGHKQNGASVNSRSSGSGMTCNNCGGIGHVAKSCPSPPQTNGSTRFYDRSSQRYAKNFSSDYNGGHRYSNGVAPKPTNNHFQSPAADEGRYSCHNCGRKGHISKYCRFVENGSDAWGGFHNYESGYASKKSAKNEQGCHKCGDFGHFARECPYEVPEEKGFKEKYIPPEVHDESLFDHGISTGINFDKYEDIQVKVNGCKNAEPHPEPIQSFEDCHFRSVLNENLRKANYSKPTPVQKYAIPIVAANLDMMACAQTGSGKTAAFLLPMIHKLLEEGVEPHMGLPQTPEILVISPTRELAIQITTEAKKFAKGSNLAAFSVYGGTSVPYQRDKLREFSFNIIVATPGRLLQFIGDDTISLKNLRFLVLDEADRMLEMGFRSDIDDIIKNPMMPPKSSRQTLMFSATFPDEIQSAAKTYLKEDYLFLGVGLVGGACDDVTQTILQVEAFDKREKLVSILEATNGDKKNKTIVFVEKKQQADFLASFLSQNEFKATSIHGDRHQSQREEAVRDFVKGRMSILVATAVAARGLDIPNVNHVINYDLPNTVEEYVHRIGRTGRVGNAGKATSFYDLNADQALAIPLVKIFEQAQQQVPEWLLDIAAQAPGAVTATYGGGFGHNFTSSDIRTRGIKAAPEDNHKPTIDEDEEWD